MEDYLYEIMPYKEIIFSILCKSNSNHAKPVRKFLCSVPFGAEGLSTDI